jgi:hypothetical protein
MKPANGESLSAFVAGEPALLLSRGESAWRDAVRSCGVTGLTHVRLRFVVRSWHRAGNRFDLDNLVDPVLGVVAAPPPLRRSTWATVETGDAPGVEISATAPPPAPPDATTVHIASVPLRSVRTTERLAELAEHVPIEGDNACGCALTLGKDTPGLVFGFDGPIKPTIDSLWPLIGGAAHTPADHRIRDLRVTVDDGVAGVRVAVWPMAAS